MTCRTTAAAFVVASCLVVGCGKPVPSATDSRLASDSKGVAPSASTAIAPSASTAVAPSGPAAEPPSAPAAASATIREITFDDIKLEMQKGEPFTRDRLTPRVTDLERQRVRIRGYILPSFQQSGLTQFVLVRDNQECCFGPGAALHDCVVVRMRPGQTAEFSIRPVAVEGRFRVEELRGPDGRHLAIYALDGERVQ
ncbi:MAG: DUF3299 domain-containing protein [Planctomycetes bacterium]|nr:DUF3299 domain-containing protein [Planctomycetota bacterium]